jgi:hypothetical protein
MHWMNADTPFDKEQEQIRHNPLEQEKQHDNSVIASGVMTCQSSALLDIGDDVAQVEIDAVRMALVKYRLNTMKLHRMMSARQMSQSRPTVPNQ